jgi:glycosyltransferase involved in cell wall biosynthesis
MSSTFRSIKVLPLTNTATLVVMPSGWEGLPSVALQAGLMARPLIATRVAGLSEVVVDQQTGLLIEQEDGEGLARAVAFLLEYPAAERRMGRTADGASGPAEGASGL